METILAYALDLGSKFMRLGGVLEASRRNLEASSRRLKHTLGRLNVASRCQAQHLSVSVTGLGVSLGSYTTPLGADFFSGPTRKIRLRSHTGRHARVSTGMEGIVLSRTKRMRC